MATGMGFSMYNINLNVNEFSIASGLNLQVAAGYSLNDFVSFELRLSAFTNSRKEFEALPTFNAIGKTDWDMKTLSLLPTVLLGHSFNRASVHIFVFSGAGVAKLNMITSYIDDKREFAFESQAAFSWGYGLEFSYMISGNYSLFTSIGFNNFYYRPDKAHMTSSYYPSEYLAAYQKEIEYVDQIIDLQVGPGSMPIQSSPDIRLRETLRSNSVALGIGIKYTPWK